MDQRRSNSEWFLSWLPERPQGGEAPAALEGHLKRLLQAGAAAWPGLALPAPEFLRHLATRLPADEDMEGALVHLCAEDLYLACACALGVDGAVEAFERSYLSQVASFVGRIDNDPQFADEVRQQLRHRLLVRDGERAPKIAEYSGRGALGSWLRVASIRVALNLRQRADLPRQGGDAAVLERLAATADPEVELIRSRYLSDFKAALRDAFALLSAKQRNLLRLYFQEGLGSAHIARALHVDRATVKRWLATARQALFSDSKRLLRERLQLQSTEFDSLLRVLRSHLDLSLTSFFEEGR